MFHVEVDIDRACLDQSQYYFNNVCSKEIYNMVSGANRATVQGNSSQYYKMDEDSLYIVSLHITRYLAAVQSPDNI